MRVHGIAKRQRNYGTFRSSLCSQTFFISGVTKDSTGTPLATCVVDLFNATTDVRLQQVVSDGSGNYSFQVQPKVTYYIVAYKADAPDLAGTTVNILVGV